MIVKNIDPHDFGIALRDDDSRVDSQVTSASLKGAANNWATIATSLADIRSDLGKLMPGYNERTEFPVNGVRKDRLNDWLVDVIEIADHLAAVYRREAARLEQSEEA